MAVKDTLLSAVVLYPGAKFTSVQCIHDSGQCFGTCKLCFGHCASYNEQLCSSYSVAIQVTTILMS